jgi:hypothetical protein
MKASRGAHIHAVALAACGLTCWVAVSNAQSGPVDLSSIPGLQSCGTIRCAFGFRCIVDKCGRAQCADVCERTICNAGQMCTVNRDNLPVCAPNPCAAGRCPSSNPSCVIVKGTAQCQACPVNMRFDAACCRLKDGSLSTADMLDCSCQKQGIPLFPGFCSGDCNCPPLSAGFNEVCCRLPDGSELSIRDCECNCRLSAQNKS